MKPLVYDLGMNEGRNVPYYLAKGCRVVAVEAVPALVRQAERRFAEAIASGDLVVLNVGIAESAGSATFHVNTIDTVHSSFVAPVNPSPDWTTIEVCTVPASAIVEAHGEAYFIKIDVEGYDLVVLRDLFRAGIRPALISAEAHTIEIPCSLVAMGYQAFQLVNQREIGRSIARREIQTIDGARLPYLFPRHSAGPFGDDLDDAWLNAEAMTMQWLGRRAFLGRGWVDVHARL